ncbi:MAG: alpha/beta fold hydrolase [Methylocystis sp.]|uniref:alpha/beta fold hydrolase n=1 Tax=Methylocystis sp. TaxID=1911079 RepID=UPI003D0BF5D3
MSRFSRAAGYAILSLLSALTGLVALVGVATLTTKPALFLALGWAAFALVYSLGCALVPFLRRQSAFCTAGFAALSLAGAGAMLWPLDGAPAPPAPEAFEWTTLPSGARLAYIKLGVGTMSDATPVIFLHGGPGVAAMTDDARHLGALAAGKRSVYLYDQLGAGRSTRLADPSGYSLPRAVADLDAFREALHAPQVDLIGYSWGATLAAAYLSAHPSRVSKVVFVSPGGMFDSGGNAIDLLSQLDATHRWTVLRHIFEPRAFLTWALAQINPRAAHAFASDAEMDSQFRVIVDALPPALYCNPPSDGEGADPGFYAHAKLMRPEAWGGVDPHAALRALDTPALILKGECDYLTWSSAIDYRDTLPNARMIYLPSAGHRLYAERREAFVAAVTTFLDGRELPFPLTTRSRPPEGYRGPAGDAR